MEAYKQLNNLELASDDADRQVNQTQERLRFLGQATVAWTDRQHDIYIDYLALTDYAGFRTKLENRSALRQLEAADEDNAGATIARAITLRRLGRPEEALDIWEQIQSEESELGPIEEAAYLECSALQDAGERPTKRFLRLANSRDLPPVVHLFIGQGYAHYKDWKAAAKSWRKGLKKSPDSVALHRNLAIVYAMLAIRETSNSIKAVEHARQASDLSQGQQWSVELARGLSLAADGQKIEALAAIERAQELTGGPARVYCEDAAEAVRQDLSFDWDFVRH